MQNLEIQFNTNVIKKVKSLHFQSDQLGSVLFILFAMYENNIELLDEFDDANKELRAIILYKELERRNLIQQAEDEENTNFTLTKEGMELVEYIKGEFNGTSRITSEEIAIAGVETLKKAVKTDEIDEWIDEWIDLFPRGVKSGGRLLRGDKPSCTRKMRVFVREYDYDKSVIMDATRAYLKSKEQDGWAYTRCAVYFIYRQEKSSADRVSDLASWCEDVLHKRTEGPERENNFEIMA